jgi:hypothetical protein
MDWLRAQRELRQSVMRPWTVKWWVALVAVCALSTLGSAAQTVLLPKGSVWKYSTAFQAGWRGTNFDDQAWLSGPAPLGYGRGDEATVISTDGPIPPITTYFRRALVVTNDLPVLTLTLRLLRDDAAVVFLNDIEVYRSNLPNGPINGLTTALLPVDGSAEDDFHQRGVPTWILRPGTNILAIELHQHATGRADARVDLELLANLPFGSPSVAFISPTNGAVFAPGADIPVRFAASDPDGHVVFVLFYTNGYYVTAIDEPYETVWRGVTPGRYVLRGRAADNNSRSADAPAVYIQVGDVTGTRLERGPYLQNATPTNVTLRWRTDWFTDSLVEFDTTPALDREAYEPEPRIDHEVRLSELQPNTKYFYTIGTRTTRLAGGADYYFITPPTNAKPTRIWAIGDSGTATRSAADVRDAYLAYAGSRETDVWLMLGDNAYDIGSDDEYQKAVFQVYPSLLRRTFLWPALGNHDTSSMGASGPFAFNDIFTLPQQGEAGGMASGSETYYAFDYSNIHFVCLDSSASDRSPGGPMLTWLDSDLAATDKDWIVAYWHHPPYSWGTHNSDGELELIQMRENVLPVLERHGVDLVLAGHSHVYERSWLLNGHYGFSSTLTAPMKVSSGYGREDQDGAYAKPAGGLGANRGTVYVVCGCSGEGGSYPFALHPAMATNFWTYGSMVIDVTGLRMDVRFLNSSGAIADHRTIRKDQSTDEVRPQLQIEREGARVVLAWPTALTPYRLQTSRPDSPFGWQPVSAPTNLVGRRFQAILDLDAHGSQLFRLQGASAP